MDYRQIRKIAIQAIFSDDVLTSMLVLKGGNALDVGMNVASRGSLDIDLSTPGAFDDVADTRMRIFAALKRSYDAHGLVVFDEDFVEIPPDVVDDAMPWWGGYRVTFKLQSRARHEQLRTRPDKARIEALPIGGAQERTFKIDISKNEYCAAKESRELDGCAIWVYSPAMLAIEKLRAICQQMPEYEVLKHKRARARDFYDIHTIVTRLSVDLGTPDSHYICREIFAAKHVPLRLLARIGDESTREYHLPDWPRVVDSVVGRVPAELDFYFNFTSREAGKLQTLWDE